MAAGMQLPQYESQLSSRTAVDIPHVPVPNVAAAFGPWTEAARQFEQTQEKLREADDAVKLAEIDSATRQDMANVSNDLTQSGDPVNRGARFLQEMRARSEKRLAAYTADGLFYTRAKAHVTAVVGSHAAQEQAFGFKLHSQQISASTDAQLDQYAMEGTPDAVERANKLIDQQLRIGLWTGDQASARKEQARKAAVENAFGRLVKADPDAAMTAVNQRQGVFSLATDIEQARMVGASQAEIRRRREEAEHTQARADDANASFIISAIERGDVKRADGISYAEGLPSTNLGRVIDAANRVQAIKDETLYLELFTLAKTDPAGAAALAERYGADDEMSGRAVTAFLSVHAKIPALFDQTDTPSVEQAVIEDYAREKPRMTAAQVGALSRPGGGLSRTTAEQWVLRYVEKAKAGGNKGVAQEHEDLRVVLHDLTLLEQATPEQYRPRIHRLIMGTFLDLYEHAGTSEEKYAKGLRVMPYWMQVKDRLLKSVGLDAQMNTEMLYDQLPPDVRSTPDLWARQIAGLETTESLGDKALVLRKAEAAKERLRRLGVGQEIVKEAAKPRKPSAESERMGAEQRDLLDATDSGHYFTMP